MKSMTGYSHVNKRTKDHYLQIVLRSGNFKYLDISVRNFPRENILMEEKIKREIRKKVSRGKIEVQIVFKKHAEGQVYIDEKIVKKYIGQMHNLAKKYKISAAVSMGDILQLPHVINWEEKIGQEDSVIVPAIKEVVRKLIDFKEKEGVVVKKEMIKNLKKLQINGAAILKRKPKANSEENSKEDIDEEISLMLFYVKKLETKIQADHALKGKAIDFLTQEILRELNAASSKTRSTALSALIVESKNYLERIREQAQNVE